MADTALRRLAVSRGRSLRRSVGEELRDLREERGLSLRELAMASGVHPSVIGRAEVYRPVRGVIDLVLTDATAGELVGAEAHGEIRRAERQLRWASENVDALPSADGWPWMEVRPRTTRLLILRSTAVTQSLVHSTPFLFSAAYPGRTADAVKAMTTASGGLHEAAVVWIDLRGTDSRLLDGPPRGVLVGR